MDILEDGIAIVGIACKFPGAKSKEEFWDNLIQNKDTIHRFSDSELEKFEYSFDKIRDMPNFIKARGYIEDIDKWDADFFKVVPKHAREMDPQQRIWLENTWHAFEDAGIDPFKYEGNIGVFAGSYLNTYLLNNVLRDPEKYELYIRNRSPEIFQTCLNNDPMFLATRTAYLFNLRGPAINVQTACSTSLVAISQACNSLFTHESDVCVSGGVTIQVPQETGYFYIEGGIESPDGYCRPFDKDGKGTVFSNGVGTVILKRLEDAIRDNDRIYAVIKGWAINNDGNQKVGFTAPSIQGQSEVINSALSFANIKPENVSYIETHGTATPIGDPIEFSSLTRVFNQSTQKKQFCGIGSVKSNIGHLDAAAGVAGLIKIALAAYHRIIPASLYYKEANPLLNIKNSPFYVLNKNLKWESKDSLIMGVSSFGVGGTNAHCILQEAPVNVTEPSKRKYHIIPVSAKSETALNNIKKELVNYLIKNDVSIPDLSYTLLEGRKRFKYRSALVCSTQSDIIENLLNAPVKTEQFKNPKIVFLFTGQGSQYNMMAKGLYDEFPVFKESLDMAFNIAKSNHGLILEQIIFSDNYKKEINKTEYAQPALFAVQYGMAKLLNSFGITPNVLIGHSIGEITAACVSGLFSFEDGLKLVITRGRLMQAQKPGAMLSIQLPADEVKKILPDNLDFALQNAPNFSVVSGDFDYIKDFQNKLELEYPDILVSQLNTSHAFHSRMMDPALDEFRREIADISFNNIEIPFVSNTTGTLVSKEDVGNIDYWVNHIRSTVNFVDGINTLLEDKNTLFIEVGPGVMLTTLLSQFEKDEDKIISVPTIRHPRKRIDDIDFFFDALSSLWVYGADNLFDNWYKGERRKRISLPAYPFERNRHWIDPLVPFDYHVDAKNGYSNLQQNNDSNISNQTEQTQEISTTLHQRPELPASYTPPVNEIEEKLVQIWQDLLGFESIGVNDDFFELGGDSLIATKLMSLIEQQTGNKLPLASLIENPTIAKLAAYMDKKFISWDSLVSLKPEGSKPPLFIVHGGEYNVLLFRNIIRYIDHEQPVYALQAKGLSGEVEPHKSVEEMASHYISEIKTINPEGPYALGGFSFGGIIAFEMAKQLKAEGKKVKILALFDSYAYPHFYYSNPLVKKIVLKLYNISQLIFMGFNMFSSVKNFKRRYGLLKLKFSGLGLRLKYGKEKQYQMQFNRSSKIDEMHGLAFSRYNLIPQDIKVDLFRSTENIYFAHDYNYLGWKKIALGGIRKHMIPGNHSEMFLPPGVNELSRILQNLLDKSE